MRYLFGFLILFFSFSSYASAPQCQQTLGWGCISPEYIEVNRELCVRGFDNSFMVPAGGTCPIPGDLYHNCIRDCSCPSNRVLQEGQCVCPAGQGEYDAGGAKICGPSSCPAGEIINIRNPGSGFIAECIPDPDQNPDPENPEDCPVPKVFDPSTGTMICPNGNESSSSTASSIGCVVPGDFNGNCIPDNEENSSAANSSPPTSQPSSSGTNSSPPSSSGGGGEGGGNGGTGGNNGGNNGGSGSASSAVSSTPSGGNSGSNTSWNPYSGYGNWIPISEDSPCPNKYVDISGQWWCGGGNNSGGANGSTGGASGSAKSAAGKCDPTNTDYLSCISGGAGTASSAGGSAASKSSSNSNSSSQSSGSGSSSGAFSSLGEKGKFNEDTAKNKRQETIDSLNQKITEIKDEVKAEFGGTVSGSGTIQDFCDNVREVRVCFGMKKWEEYLVPISSAIFLIACVLSFVIVLRR